MSVDDVGFRVSAGGYESNSTVLHIRNGAVDEQVPQRPQPDCREVCRHPIERGGVVVDIGDNAIRLIRSAAHFLIAAIAGSVTLGRETSATADMRIVVVSGKPVLIWCCAAVR